jgi:hypothetical protein
MERSEHKVDFGWISESYQIFRRDAGVWLLGTVIYLAVAFAFNYGVNALIGLFEPNLPQATLPANNMSFDWFKILFMPGQIIFKDEIAEIATVPVHAFFYGGLCKMANKSVRGQSVSLRDVFSGGPTMLTFILLLLVDECCSIFGIASKLVLSAIVLPALFLPAYSMAADGESFYSSVGRSFQAMKKDWIRAMAFTFVFMLVMIASFVCLCLPCLVTLSMNIIISALANRDMAGAGVPSEELPLAPPGSWPPPLQMGG